MDYADSPMTPVQMQNVRIQLTEAARQPGNEGRIGRAIVKEFDRIKEPLAPQIKQANAVYAHAMRGKEIEEAIELAGSRAGQFSGSGFENALRTEFRALERKIIKGQLKGHSAQQVAAIKRVARGGPIENLARNIRKAAPTNVVSAASAGGMPFLVGNALGGPVAGAVTGLGTMSAGLAGRKVATGMQRNNALLTSALSRSEGGLPAIGTDEFNALSQWVMKFGGRPKANRLMSPQ